MGPITPAPRPPLAQRAAARRRRLLDAGHVVIGAEGVAGTRVRAVCERAGLTERYFYESFPSLDEFVPAVVEDVAIRTASEVMARIDARAPDQPLARVGLTEWLRIVDEAPGTARILLVETLAGGTRLMALRRRIVLGSAAVLASRSEGVAQPEAPALWERAAAIAGEGPGGGPVDPLLIALAGAVAEITVARLEGLIATPRDELVSLLLGSFGLGRRAV